MAWLRFAPLGAIAACAPGGDGGPVGAEGVDCDDRDPASGPGRPEVACDGRDNDCAGDGDDRAGCDLDYTAANQVVTFADDPGLEVSPYVYLRAVPDLGGDGRMDLVGGGAIEGTPGTLLWSPASVVSAAPSGILADVAPIGLSLVADLDSDGANDAVATAGFVTWNAPRLYTGPLAGLLLADGRPAIGSPDEESTLHGAAVAWDSDGDGAVEILTWWMGILSWQAPPFDGTGASASQLIGGIEESEASELFPELLYEPYLTIADLDADGVVEILAANASMPGVHQAPDDDAVHVLRGSPAANQSWATESATIRQNEGNHAWAFADFDADGDLDVAGAGPKGVAVAYGPLPVQGTVLLEDLAGLTLDGEVTQMQLVPDFDGDGRPEVLFGCPDRLVLASLAVPGHVADACQAGPTFAGPTTPFPDPTEYYDWFAAGDFNADGFGDLAVVEWGPASSAFPPAVGLRLWYGGDP